MSDSMYIRGHTGTDPIEPVTFDSADLTTHGVIVGMTGSGKTGFAITLLEEVLLAGIPVLAIDPKGDLGNLALRLPELSGEQFAPWVAEADIADADGDRAAAAAAVAQRWRTGLAGWNIPPDRIARFVEAAEVTIHTPGSTAGVPLNVVGSLAAPVRELADDTEAVRHEISGYVTSLRRRASCRSTPCSSRRVPTESAPCWPPTTPSIWTTRRCRTPRLGSSASSRTERDKARIIEGLRSVRGDVDVDDLDRRISGLDTRQFILHCAHLDAPVELTSRWAMSYLADHLRREQQITILHNAALKLHSRVDEPRDAFLARCEAAAQELADAEAAKLTDTLRRKERQLSDKLARARQRVEQLEVDESSRKRGELLAGAGQLLSVVFGGRRSTRSVVTGLGRAVSGMANRRGTTARTAQRREAAEETATRVEDDLSELEERLADELTQIDARWRAATAEITELDVGLERDDIDVTQVALVWARRDT
ncbi:MAG: DUF853 family protein [Actinobacteria bacterium]|nr:DUF853 family protein [Actinomycetota bacterium]